MEQWSQRRFDEALIILQATNRDKWPPDEETIKQDHPRPDAITILDHERPFWEAFVVEGGLDVERLSAAGYSGPQVPWIAAEMRKLGWI